MAGFLILFMQEKPGRYFEFRECESGGKFYLCVWPV